VTVSHLPAGLDPDLPAADRLATRARLGRLLDSLPWLDRPDGARAAVRLRWKPATSVRVGAVVPTAAGPAAVLVVAAAPGGESKLDKVAARAAHLGLPVHRGDGVVAVPAAADPQLRGLVPAGTPLAYNPARRWVGRTADGVTKVHAAALPAGVVALLDRPPAALTAHLAPARVDRDGRRVRLDWVPGHPPGPADLAAVAAALDALHRCPAPPGLPVVDADSAVRAASAAARAAASARPAEYGRIVRLLTTLGEHSHRWPEPAALVHGDFSPDQVVVRDDHAVLLDLDRAAHGPRGWDWAQWTVAQLACGPVGLPAPAPVDPLLALTAALVRAPEPFRRLRPRWPARLDAVLAHAEDAAARLRAAP
jgi:hypothetical protein